MSYFSSLNISDTIGFPVGSTPLGEMRVAEPIRLVGASFEGNNVDTNFWTPTTSGVGSSINQVNAELTLSTGTNSGSYASIYTVRRARYISASSMRYRTVVQISGGAAGNKRRWGVGWASSGMPIITEGAYFQMNGTTFGIRTLKNGVETPSFSVDSGAFNGDLGATWTPGTGSYVYEIYWNNSSVWFVVNNTVLHKIDATSTTWAGTMSLHVFSDSNNSSNTIATTLSMRTACISRLGKLETAPIYKHITTATGLILKDGPGILHRVVYNTFVNGASVTFYDSITATNIIAIMSPANNIYPGSVDYNLSFYNSLSITVTGTVDLTVIYE